MIICRCEQPPISGDRSVARRRETWSDAPHEMRRWDEKPGVHQLQVFRPKEILPARPWSQ